jgi:predicted DNA-binding transcriptional regulator YafY
MLLPPSLRGPVKRREPVVIKYVDAAGNPTTRKILLKEVAAQRDYIYLVAYCYARQAERTFRLDRIIHWEPLPEDAELE